MVYVDRRRELLEKLLDHALAHGLSDSSLRAGAASAGTSARMLIYHFESREKMIVELLDFARTEQEATLRGAVQELGSGQIKEKLTRIWHTLSSKRFEGHARLFYEAFGRGIQGKSEYAVVLKGTVTFLGELLESIMVSEGLPRQQARITATLVSGSMRGLVMDLLSTNDRSRVNAAAYKLIEEVTS